MSGDQAGSGTDSKKRKIAVFGISSLMLVAMVCAVAVGIRTTHQKVDPKHDGGGDHGDLSATTKAVQSICQTTDYRQACERSLSHANTSDPKELIRATFHAAMEEIESALKNSSTIKAVQDDPRTAGALEACKQVMEYAVGDLTKSVDQMGEFDWSKVDDYVENTKVWLSGAITYHETCLDAFENTTGDAGEKMKKLLNTSQELTSNALAVATQLSTIITSLNIPGLGDLGRLLSEKSEGRDADEKFPHWADVRQRKLLETPGSAVKADVVVAKDGSGKFKTITEALKEVPVVEPSQGVVMAPPPKIFVIYIKEGVYDEIVRVERNMLNVMFIGDGPTKTKITGKKNFADRTPIYLTATVAINGNNFIAKDIGFENTAGPEKHQAIALLVQSDMSTFYNCQIDGYHNTLSANSYRQFYRDCTISGTLDIVTGDAAAVFQNCHFVIRKPLENQKCVVTAQARSNLKEITGFVLQNCTITGDPTYLPVKLENKSYLGRTLKRFSRVIVMQSFIDDSIAPEGWWQAMGKFGTDTCFFAEFENKGPGSDNKGRVKWAGIKKISPTEALDFTPSKYIDGDKWITPSQVPYVPGMMTV